MKNEEKFNEVLNDNEKIVKIYKPNKLKYWVSKALWLLCFAAFLAAFVSLVSFMHDESADATAAPVFNVTSFAIYFSISLVIWILTFVYLIFYYRKLFYCITTERVIIRKGVFGTDYKTLDMQMIGATNVHVSLLDKIVHHNTGSIVFGSNSAPIMGQGSTFIFRDIVDPYKESKEIKTAIDNYKSNFKETASQAKD